MSVQRKLNAVDRFVVRQPQKVKHIRFCGLPIGGLRA
jgi:hypothetical protein